jgi:signal transduction histidine kinase
MRRKVVKLTLLVILGLFLVLCLGYVDYITGFDLNFFVFYFIPISFIAWFAGRSTGILFSILAALVWLYVDRFSGHPYTQPSFAYWNAFIRWSSFVILAIAISQIKSMLEKEKLLKEELSHALQQIKDIIAVARKVAEGDIAAVPQTEKNSHSGELDETFDFMLNKLAEQKTLEKRLHQLERQAMMAETASFLAHEIRNPLNLIMLTAHHLGTQFSPKEGSHKEKFEELILSLKSEVEQLNKVVADFMAIGKPSEVAKATFRVADMVEQLHILIKQQLVSKKIDLKIDGDLDCDLFADQERLRLVLLNILVNAIAVVPENGVIWLHAEKSASPNALVFTVTDNGPGIAPDDLQKIFDPYFSRRIGGTGLGLSLAKRIVEEHNGTIMVDNCPGKGARFTITLPMEAI